MSQRAGPTEAITVPFGPDLEKTREELRQLVAAGHAELRVDLADTTEITPSGIYLLLAARHSLQAKTGGRLLLVNLADGPRELLAGLHLEEELGLSV